MGYTHYWYRESEYSTGGFCLFVRACKKIIEKSGVIIKDGWGENVPVLDMNKIVFNGDAETDQDHETFYFPRVLSEEDKSPIGFTDNKFFFFTKTARKDYDKVVCACLVAAKNIFGEHITIHSDGDYAKWEDGIKLACEVMGPIPETLAALKNDLEDHD